MLVVCGCCCRGGPSSYLLIGHVKNCVKYIFIFIRKIRSKKKRKKRKYNTYGATLVYIIVTSAEIQSTSDATAPIGRNTAFSMHVCPYVCYNYM